MLTAETKVIFDLLVEFRNLCRSLKISYFLAPRLCLHVAKEAGMPLDPATCQILMKAEDMERLRVHLKENPIPGRAVESLMDGGSFPGFYLIYENLNTLYLNPNQGGDYQNPCLGVIISPLRPGIYETLGRKLNYMEKGWRNTCASTYRTSSLKERILTTPYQLLCQRNREKMGPELYKTLLKASLWKERANCFVIIKDRFIKLPSSLFQEERQVMLEGEGFSVPGDMEGYLTAVYGPEYLNKSLTYVVNPKVTYSARISAKEYLDQIGGLQVLKDYGRQRKKIYKKNRKIAFFKQKLDIAWRYVKNLTAEREMEVGYLEQMEAILELQRQDDYGRLWEIFQPYHEKVIAFQKKGRFPALPTQLFPVYLDTLAHVGDYKDLGSYGKQLKRIQKRVRRMYREALEEEAENLIEESDSAQEEEGRSEEGESLQEESLE